MGVRLAELHAVSVSKVSDEIISAYRNGTPLSDDARTYIAFLQAVELLADVRTAGGVDVTMADKYLASVIRADIIPLSLLAEMQKSLGDNEAYANTRKLLATHSHARSGT
jgi:hypothetical protein